MPFEIIRRKEGEISQKQEIRHKNTQISINDYGHLVIREFDDPRSEGDCSIGRENCAKEGNKVCRDFVTNYQCEHYKIARTDEEHLIVMDKETTDRLIKFIFENRSTYEFRTLLKELIKKCAELPF